MDLILSSSIPILAIGFISLLAWGAGWRSGMKEAASVCRKEQAQVEADCTDPNDQYVGGITEGCSTCADLIEEELNA